MVEAEVKRWGFQTWVTKALRSDAAIDLDAMLMSDFRHRIPEGHVTVEDPTLEWLDLDSADAMFMAAGLRYEMGLADDEPLNMWMVRVVGSVIEVPA